jgi:hypothetical protein
MRSDLLSRQVAVRTDLADALPTVSGDRNQLQQVLLNFVINGCDAMDGRETDRRLLVRTQTTANGNVEVSVADRGAGIPPADLVFTNESALRNFINQGWEFGGQLNLSAMAGGQGGMFSGAAAVSPDVCLYQLTQTGLSATLTVGGTKFFKDGDLN